MFKSSLLSLIAASLLILGWGSPPEVTAQQGDISSDRSQALRKEQGTCNSPELKKQRLEIEKKRHDSKIKLLRGDLDNAQQALRKSGTPNRTQLLMVEIEQVSYLIVTEENYHQCLVEKIKQGCPRGWETQCLSHLSKDKEGPLAKPSDYQKGEVAKDTRGGTRSPGRVDLKLEKYLRDNQIMCVDMLRSSLRVDKTLANTRIEDYNCFYYVKTFIKYIKPLPNPLPPFNTNYGATEDLWEEDLTQAGYKGHYALKYSNKIFWFNHQAQIGDIIMVKGTSPWTKFTYPYVHSAIVTEVDGKGQILKLRQKIDPFHCVADLTWEQFQTLYPGEPKGDYWLWTNPGRAGSLR